MVDGGGNAGQTCEIGLGIVFIDIDISFSELIDDITRQRVCDPI